MRQARIRGEGVSYYHCISRVVDRQYIFGEEEKEFFVAMMRKLEAYFGMRVVTYCVMSNHYHILVEEPDEEAVASLAADEILRRIKLLKDATAFKTVKQELERARDKGDSKWEEEILNRYRRRMGDVSVFMQELKQRFSQWYNRRNGRKGTLWEGRFKSVLVEGDDQALTTMAAYIDLNPVRAGMVAKVEDYRWCGYASALGGNRWAREGLGRILSASRRVSGDDFEKQWAAAAPVYRLLLYSEGEVDELPETGKRAIRAGFEQKDVEKEAARSGQMSLEEVLRCRIRYFSDGVVLGSASFVNEVFEKNRGQFGKKRKTGARAMKEADWRGLHVLRDLRGKPIG